MIIIGDGFVAKSFFSFKDKCKNSLITKNMSKLKAMSHLQNKLKNIEYFLNTGIDSKFRNGFNTPPLQAYRTATKFARTRAHQAHKKMMCPVSSVGRAED